MSDQAEFLPHASEQERSARMRLASLLAQSPIPEAERIHNVLLYARRQLIADVMAMDWLYKQVLQVPGVICEFGCRYGQRLALFAALRGLNEPFNAHRRIVGFDTFTGFPDVASKDVPGGATPGRFATVPNYAEHLRAVLESQEMESPLAHVRRFEIIEGDVRETLPTWLARNPSAIVGLAYFDLDLYEPTRQSIEAIRSRLVTGSVLAFDEFAHPEWPGETTAVIEALGVRERKFVRLPGRFAPTVVVW